jgi:hypothetical protein
MSPAELREVVADLLDETPTVMPDGRMRGQEWRPAGVHRRGVTVEGGCREHRLRPEPHCGRCSKPLADVAWYETAMEWFGRNSA